MLIVPDREALSAAMRSIVCACLVAISSRPRVDPVRDLVRSAKLWPMARLVWFERYARPVVPSGAEARVPLGTLLIGPFHDDLEGALAVLIQEIERALEQRARQARLGHRFAQDHRLPPLAARLIVGVAMGVPEPRWADLLDQESEQHRSYRSRTVYARLQVNNVAELQSLVWAFERRLPASGDVEGNGSTR